MSKQIKSPEEYAASASPDTSPGCPVCGGDDVEGESTEIEGDVAAEEVYCPDCGSSWTNVYVLRGYRNLYVNSDSN